MGIFSFYKTESPRRLSSIMLRNICWSVARGQSGDCLVDVMMAALTGSASEDGMAYREKRDKRAQ